ncbi:MAG TPA: chemotaxis protein CheW [Thermoanaerobaculia bacterium]|nr:chemotaxis protein CheW [Thermoanaerobaculia bacterium]
MMPMPTAARTPERTQFLTFSLSGGEYAIAVLRVREIIEHEEVTRVPSTPEFLRGVINLRGCVVPVVDLARKFRMPESPVTKRTCIIIVEVESENGKIVLGVLADAVNQVVEFRAAEIEPPPSFGTPVRVDFLRGLGKLNGEFVLILDTDRVLSAGELADAASTPEASASAPDGRAASAAPAPGGRA